MSSVTESAPGTTAIDTRAVAAQPAWRRLLATRATGILVLDLLLFLLFTVLSDGLFASLANVQSLLLSMTEALLLAVGLAMMLGAGIFDLSLGANLVLSSVVGATLMSTVGQRSADGTSYENLGVTVAVGVGGCLLTGALFGLVNGFLVAYWRINALIATLGTLGVGTGLAFVVSGGADIAGLPPEVQSGFGLVTLGVIPVPAIVALLIAAAMYFCIRFTRFGSRTVAIGSATSAAERAGIRVPLHLLRLAVLAGLLAGVAGFIDLSHFTSTSLNGHANDALNAVTAAVIGGTLLEGGKVSIPGALWGTGLAVILQGGLVIVGVSSYYQLMAVGIVLIVAVGLDRVSSLRRDRR
ncbi:ABC transporter permease [Actinoplanes sp. RD1]|uniref:ABC transporter permease n=1 Tax=Actinoplanes sp. RD1 TaxID=3064538 RepID=UPI0027420E7A|nr:ABC transporter permease [Actinoplanes sp. RD1]